MNPISMSQWFVVFQVKHQLLLGLCHSNLERCITIQYICWDDSDKEIVKMGNHFATLDDDNVQFDKVEDYTYPPIFDDGPSTMMAHLFLSQVNW